MASQSLAGRAFAAVLLMIGFYVLALAIGLGLLYIPYAGWKVDGRIHGRLVLFCVVGGGVILWSIIPRPDKFETPGPQLDERGEPELFALIRDVAQATEQEMPAEVYLVPDVNAWVSQRGGIMGFGGRRVMGIGLPLLQTLTIPQLRAVLAHEFGHYHGGDTKLGPWIYKTREAIWRTVQNVAASNDFYLHKPFEWYGIFFMRITQAISRAQELAADRLSASVAGAKNAADALVAVHRVGVAYQAYWTTEVLPVLGSGYRPPIGEGLARFTSTETIAAAVQTALDEELRTGEGDVYDSHPPLRERVTALEVLPQTDAATGDPMAYTLLRDMAALETALIVNAFNDPADAAKLQPVQWDDVATTVYLPEWVARRNENAEFLRGFTATAVPDLLQTVPQLGPRLKLREYDVDLDQAATSIVASGLAVQLHETGWMCDAPPGKPIAFTRDGVTIEPFNAVTRLHRGELGAEAWVEQCRAAGIDEMKLA